MKSVFRNLALIPVMSGFVYASVAQTDSVHWNYIYRYSPLAIEEMRFSKVPASITMAQALHESRYGTSELAVNANNHFGIKCQTEWNGRRYYYQDDDKNNCFRLYDSVEQSFRDHSLFLMYRPRYAFLFDLEPYDYVGWAEGLKKAGYATNPQYAKILIKLIEDYKLFLLDTMQEPIKPILAKAGSQVPNRLRPAELPKPRVLQRNRVSCMQVGEGDNIDRITTEMGMRKWEIRKYNEIGPCDDVVPGQVVYLQPKRMHAESAYHTHEAAQRETMYAIAQTYGIKLKWLYWRNRMVPGTEPRAGQLVWLRGRRPLKSR